MQWVRRVFSSRRGAAARDGRLIDAAWVWGQALLRRLIDLSCLGWLPADQGSSRGCLALRSSMGRGHFRVRTRVPLTCGLPPGRCSVEDDWELPPGWLSVLCWDWASGLSDGPDEAERLAGDGGDGDLLDLAAHQQVAIAARQSMASLVGDLLHGRRQAGGRGLAGCGGPPAVGPGRFDQRLACPLVAGLGQTAAPDRFAAGSLADV